MISLEVKDLTKSFGYRKVFEEINFSIKSGKSLVITGKNGSGKTTLLKILAGFLRPSKGEVVISLDGQIRKKEDKRKLLGFVAPDLFLYDELTALENLEFLVQIQGLGFNRSELNKKLEEMGLRGRGDDLVSSYSSGMKQRLKYVFALLNNPRILLLDEPGSNLDEPGICLLDKIIEEQKKRGILVLATNDKRETKYGDEILNLDEKSFSVIP
ncbi:MAG: heme ABC exporter ATP-binding protein CcmA [candidate division Zixibacteria bacterium]|nr:heme ABC exporter ATP-binding protein CcmA [candidate division Zixibacteria bacterium]